MLSRPPQQLHALADRLVSDMQYLEVEVSEGGIDIPVNFSVYCGRPNFDKYSTHCFVVHSSIETPGEILSKSWWPNVVGVGSVEGGSESVGEVSSSVGMIGEVRRLRSYSSSASESA